MKNFNKFTNESVKDHLKPKTPEEIELAWQHFVIKKFDDANKNSKSSINLDNSEENKNWRKYSEPYFLYENGDVKYYVYKNKLFFEHTYETGGWYATELVRYEKTIDQIKEKLNKEIQQREEALKKLG